MCEVSRSGNRLLERGLSSFRCAGLQFTEPRKVMAIFACGPGPCSRQSPARRCRLARCTARSSCIGRAAEDRGSPRACRPSRRSCSHAAGMSPRMPRLLRPEAPRRPRHADGTCFIHVSSEGLDCYRVARQRCEGYRSHRAPEFLSCRFDTLPKPPLAFCPAAVDLPLLAQARRLERAGRG